jgi:hypothetical protein
MLSASAALMTCVDWGSYVRVLTFARAEIFKARALAKAA